MKGELKMKHAWKKGLSLLLALLLVMQLFPMAATAQGSGAAPIVVDAAGENTELLTTPLDGAGDVQIDPNAEVTFLVELETAPLITYLNPASDSVQSLAASSQAASIQSAQAQARQEIEALDGLEILDTYSLLLNGFAVSGTYAMQDTIAALPGVRAVEVAQRYDAPESPVATVEPYMHSSGSLVNVSDEYTGAGILVGVLDSGLDIHHEAFATAPETVALTKDEVSVALENLNFNAQGTVDELYASAKIPFQYDYADGDADVTDAGGHGTHVAGTVAANCEALTGMAPDAQLAIFKVFSDTISGTGDEWLLPALEDAVKLGVDVINMSLGSASGFTSDGEIMDRVYGRIEDAGITLMIAAGNDGTSTTNHHYGDNALASNPDNAMVGSPSTIEPAMAVASVENLQKFVNYFQVGDMQIQFADANDESIAFTTLDGTYEYVVVPGYGAESDYAGLDVAGKVALVMRGSLNFTDKEAAAANAGAVAMVVYDNAPGELTNMQVNGLIPSCFISLADGTGMKSAEVKSLTVSPESSTFVDNEVAGQMSTFSSWGPGPSLTLKPEITAPGGHIYSSLPGGEYGDNSGTSMASPHMAGIAAGMRQYLSASDQFSGLSAYRTGQLVDALLMSTAVPLTDPDGVYYSPRSQGAGLANMEAAIQTTAYLSDESGDIAKGELGSSETGSFTYTFWINNFGSETLRYQIDTAVLVPGFYYEDGVAFMAGQDRQLEANEYTLTYSGAAGENGQVTVLPGSKVQVTVELNLTQTGISNLQVFTNGIYVEGFIRLSPLEGGSVALGAPFLGFYGDWYQAPILEPTVFDDETPLTNGTPLGMFNYRSGTGFLLGMNMVTGEYDSRYSAISGYYCLVNGVSALVYQLRNAKYLQYTVTRDDTGEVYYNNVTVDNIRSVWSADYGLFTYSTDGNMWDMTCEYEGGLISQVPDGAYTYTVTAYGEGASQEDGQSVSMPIVIDSVAPEVLGYEVVEENGVRYLDVEVSDNNYLMGVQLTDVNGEIALSEATYLAGDEPGETVTLRFDLTTAIQYGYTMASLYMADYAMNETFSDALSLSIGGFQPESITISPSQVATTVGTTWQFTATVEPAEYLADEQKQVTWSVSDETIASVTADGVVTGLKPGQVTLTATACNGITASTWLSFAEAQTPEVTQIPDVSEYTITESGTYRLPEAQSSQYIHLTIDPAATVVTLQGDPEITYRDLKVHCPGAVELTLDNVHIALELSSSAHGTDWRYYGAINFQATGNFLLLTGENSITRNAANNGDVSAICVRARRTDIESSVQFYGPGSMTIDATNPTGYSSCYAAAIGGRQGERTGDMTFGGGTWTIRNNGSGACIGTGTNSGSQYDSTLYTSKITINNGTFVLETNHTATEVGACIGSGSSSYNGVDVVINGGDITATSWYGGAAIGSGMYGHSSSYAYGAPGVPTNPTTVTINGGTVRAYSNYHEDASAKSPAAAIGSGYRAGANVPVTIAGGWVYAESNTEGAAIGNGPSDRYANASITVTGGTVTALSTAEGAAIGGGGSTVSTAAAAGIVTIAGGSVKATATGTGDAIGNAAGSDATVHVWNDQSIPVYAVPIPSAGCNYLRMDGTTYRFAGDHPEDENHYLYLPEGTYMVYVSGGTYGGKSFDVTVTSEDVTVREHGYIQYYSVTANLTNLTANAPERVVEGETLAFTLAPERGYGLPEAITVTMGGQMLISTQYGYDSISGQFTLENVTGDVVITAAGVGGIQTYTVSAQLAHMTFRGQDYAAEGQTATGTLVADEGYQLPEMVTVTMGGQPVDTFTYDPATGEIAIPNVTGDVVISGTATLKGGRTITYVLSHLTHDGATEYVSGSDLEINFTPDEGYLLPETVSVTGDQAVIRFTYNPDTGRLTILNATGNLTITAEAVLPDGVDTEALGLMVEEAKTLLEHVYTTETWPAFATALANAEALLDSPDATAGAVSAAAGALSNAWSALRLAGDTPADFAAGLTQTVKMSRIMEQYGLLEGKDAGAYTAARDAAAATAEAMATATDVEAARTEATQAFEALRHELYLLNFQPTDQNLEDLIAYCQSDAVTGTEESMAYLGQVLAEVEAEKDGDTYTTRYLFVYLTYALAKVEPVEIDTTALAAVLDGTKDAYDHPEDYAAGEAYDNFRAAYEAAQAVLANPESQVQVDEAAEALRAAYALLTEATVYFTIGQNLTGVTSDAPAEVESGSTVVIRLTPEAGYLLPTGVSLSPSEAFATAAYDPETGVIILFNVTGDVTVSATAMAFPYTDVPENQWYYDPVSFVTRWGLMNGMDATRFMPSRTVSREMVAVVLYRMAGSPAVSGTLPFTDVRTDGYYYDAVLWCYQNGITDGIGDNRYGIGRLATREQMATFLYRFAQFMGYDTPADGDLSVFPDTVSGYAQEAMRWAVGAGLFEGDDTGRLRPQANCTRAQLAALLMRFCQQVMA